MKIGIILPVAGPQATRENIIHTANRAEKEGVDSLSVYERLLWPINPQTPYSGTSDGSLPVEYQFIFDPLETLTFVAANTGKIALGTSVIDMLWSPWLDLDRSKIITIPDSSGVYRVHESMRILFIGSSQNVRQSLLDCLADDTTN